MDTKNLHIAIIPDGNRRWAQKRGVSFSKGYKLSTGTVEKIYNKAFSLEIPYLTFWFSSIDNFKKRSKVEVYFLKKLISNELKQLAQSGKLKEKEIKIRILGRFRKFFAPKAVEAIENMMQRTEKHKLFYLTILLAYSGTDEMLEAVKKIVSCAKKSAVHITEDLIRNFLWTKDLPPVDLIIRTGCDKDPHNSAGFMMWHTAYSQYYFTETLFPDFTPEEFEKAVKSFLDRKRRIGR